MRNTLKVEIAREARRSYPLKKEKPITPDAWVFPSLKAGTTVYLIRHGEGPVAQVVKKVGASEATLEGSGTIFRLDTGLVKACAHDRPCIVLNETLALKESADMIRLRKELARAFGVFTASKPNKSQLIAVLRLLDPESWK